jgi:hypothetical protein
MRTMRQKYNLDNYAVLMYVGPVKDDKQEYWITYGGHAHSQSLTGLSPGTLGKRKTHGRRFRAVDSK